MLRRSFKFHLAFTGCLMGVLLASCGGGDRASDADAPRQAQSNARPANPAASEPDRGDLQVSYGKTTTANHQALQKFYQDSQLFEIIAKDFNARFALPRNIRVELGDCNMINAYYNPRNHSITMCTEMTEAVFATFKRSGASSQEALQSAAFANAFFFYHEAGHMMINELKLPVVGREEDAADGFSSFYLTRIGGDFGQRSIAAAAQTFALWSTPPKDARAFMDEHSLNQQRFYSLVCSLYVDDPKKFSPIAQRLGLTQDRLQQCRRTDQQNASAWSRLLKPYTKQKS